MCAIIVKQWPSLLCYFSHYILTVLFDANQRNGQCLTTTMSMMILCSPYSTPQQSEILHPRRMSEEGTNHGYDHHAVHQKFKDWLQLRDTPQNQGSVPRSFNATLMETAGINDPLCAFHLLEYLNVDPFGTHHKHGEDGILDEQQIEGWDYKATARRQREAWELKEQAAPSKTHPSRTLHFTSGRQSARH
jgi:hypothetical protein